LYDQLFKSQDYRSVDVRVYLEDIVEGIESQYTEKPIRLVAHIDELTMDAKNLMPLGLVVNELLSNCYKHAFPDGQAGTIELIFQALDGHAVLTVRDDGVGMDLKKAEAHTGFGMTLIRSLAEQLSGELMIDVLAGTEISLRFPA
jgi:two-component system, sensor histidine kinase PdtaS